MIQCVKRELNDAYTYGELCEMAASENCGSFVDCNDARFLSPESMIKEIKEYCSGTNQKVPGTPAELAAVIYNSLAKCYGTTIKEIEELTGRTFKTINIIGGGANADYLNGLTAEATGKKVVAGPVEATAIGSLAVQMITAGEFRDLKEARDCIYNSFEMRIVE